MTHAAAPAGRPAADQTAFTIIAALSFSHMLNDLMQSLIPAIYPMLKENYALDFAQIGLLTLAFNTTASLFQPIVGLYTDKHPQPYSLTIGMGFSLVGLILLANANAYWLLLIAASLVGLGSAVFHPESSRMARLASGGRHGLAQSLFQVGGNVGSAIGPLLAALIVLPRGQGAVAWFSLAAMVAMIVLFRVGGWYVRHRAASAARPAAAVRPLILPRAVVTRSITVLGLLVFSKYVYLSSLTSYYTFYTMHKFALSVRDAQMLLFVFLGAVAVGTIIGGPIGDRVGRKPVIWGSILGTLPFTLALPYASLPWTVVLTIIIGLIMASAFSAIIVFAQELVPGKVGLIGGLFFGFAFGMGGIGAAVLGVVADWKGIDFVYRVCAFLPLIGLLTIFLPDMAKERAKAAGAS